LCLSAADQVRPDSVISVTMASGRRLDLQTSCTGPAAHLPALVRIGYTRSLEEFQMLDTTQVLAKTDLGRDAISKRSHGLNPRQRAVLISINGELSVGALRARFGAGKEAELETMLEHLLEQGLVERTRVEPAPSAPPVSPPVATAPAEPAPATPPRETAAAPVVVAVAETAGESLPEGPDWRVLRDRAGALLHQVMGEDADLLAMRLERSRTEREFMDHLERSFAVVESARGQAAAASYRAGILSAAA